MEKMDFRNKCYQTKDDKRHNTIFITKPLNITQERWEEIFGPEEERIKRLKEWKEKKCSQVSERVNAPNISLWDDELTVLSTGKKMTKRQLKEYCKVHGKIWENE